MSLIVLIVTIIVIIILAAIVFFTLSKNNPIESATEAAFKEDLRTFQDELSMEISKQYAQAGGKRDKKINANKYTKDGDENSVYTYISSFKQKYEQKLLIQDDELKFTNKSTENEKKWLVELNLKSKLVLLPDEYQQVEYIKSTGTEWINTKFTPAKPANYKYSVDFQMNDVYKSTQTIIGNDTMDLAITKGVLYDATSNTNVGTSRHIAEMEVKSIDSDNHSISWIVDGILTNTKTYSYWVNSIVAIFTNPSAKEQRMAYTKIYRAKIYNNNTLIRDFIPCYCIVPVINAENENCVKGTIELYDIIEGEFYTSQGSGTFERGVDI